MSGLDDGVPAWWDRLDGERQAQIEQAARSRVLDDNDRRALDEASCPMAPYVHLKHVDGLEGATEGYVWREPLRQYVLLQPWWDRLDDSDRQIARRSLETGYELQPEMIEMCTRTRCPIMLDNHGYPPDPKSWVISLPDSLHALISHKFGL